MHETLISYDKATLMSTWFIMLYSCIRLELVPRYCQQTDNWNYKGHVIWYLKGVMLGFKQLFDGTLKSSNELDFEK
jgi:hypothetical protein